MVSWTRFMNRPNDCTNADLEFLYRYGTISFGRRHQLTPEEKAVVRGVLLVRWNNGTNVVSIGNARKGRGTCRDVSYKTATKDDFTVLDKAVKVIKRI